MSRKQILAVDLEEIRVDVKVAVDVVGESGIADDPREDVRVACLALGPRDAILGANHAIDSSARRLQRLLDQDGDRGQQDEGDGQRSAHPE